jgi:glycosyltransferase involved in cell wall biosynthesis
MMPTKLFEYIAMGKPVIATDFPSMRVYFDDEAVRYYVPGDENDLASGVLDLYSNPEKRAKIAASASIVYQKLRWDVMKYEYLKVFDQLTKAKCRVHPEKAIVSDRT